MALGAKYDNDETKRLAHPLYRWLSDKELLILILGITFLVWGWPPSFEVKGFWWN
jgi:hypothetical protein